MTQNEIHQLAQRALDAACLEIQNAMGVATGDIAAQVFSDDKVLDAFRAYIRTELVLST